MKHRAFLIGLFLAPILVLTSKAALDLEEIPNQAGTREIKAVHDRNVTNLEAQVYTKTEVAALQAAQADTNATTTATQYTPRRVGDILTGGAGTGTNAVWVSKGTTTNDWIQVEP